MRIGRYFDRIYNKRMLKKNHVVFGNGLSVNGRLFISADKRNSIIIGDNVKINSSEAANHVSGIRTKLCTNKGGKIIIGNRVGMSNVTIYSFEEIAIEDDVFLGAGVRIYDTDFHSINYEERMNNTGTKQKAVKICKGAFIGAEAMILKGVTIGRNSVVGAGSVVTKSIPDNEVWGGNPAHLIRKIKDDLRDVII